MKIKKISSSGAVQLLTETGTVRANFATPLNVLNPNPETNTFYLSPGLTPIDAGFRLSDISQILIDDAPVAFSGIDDLVSKLSASFFLKASGSGGGQFTSEEVTQLKSFLTNSN